MTSHLKTKMVDLFGLPVQEVNFQRASPEHLVALSTNSLPADMVTAAAKWASESSDQFLHKQISFVSHFSRLAANAAACSIYVNNVLLATTRPQRGMNEDAVDMLSKLRAQVSETDWFLSSAGQLLKVGVSDWLHCPTLDRVVCVEALQATLEGARFVEAVVAKAWLKDIDDLAAALSSSCPPWEHARQDLLKRPDVLKTLMDNVSLHYSKIGPLVNELKEHLRLLKVLDGDGHGFIIEPAKVKEKGALVSHGIETVAYTYLVWQLCKELPQIESPKLVKDRVDTIRQKVVCDHRVSLTPQMETVLKAVAAGETSDELVKPDSPEAAEATEAAATSSAEVLPPPASSPPAPAEEPPAKKSKSFSAMFNSRRRPDC